MRDEFCEACKTLEADAEIFMTSGVTTAVANRLEDDNGFASPSSVDTDCEALNLANDCLVGGAGDELENYDVCDIKTWLSSFVDGLHKVLAAIIAAICGLWTKIHCILNGLRTLLTQLTKTDSFKAQVNYLISGKVLGKVRENHRQIIIPVITNTYNQWNALTVTKTTDTSGDVPVTTLTYDTPGVSGGQLKFPSDGIAIISCCMITYNPYNTDADNHIIFYLSNSEDSVEQDSREPNFTVMNQTRALHSGYEFPGQSVASFSQSFCTAIKVYADTYLRIRITPRTEGIEGVSEDSLGQVCIHQLAVTFVPDFTSALNVDPTLFDSCGD